MKKIIISTFLTFMLLCWASSVKAQALIDLETGAVFTGYNDVRIPGDEGYFLFVKRRSDS